MYSVRGFRPRGKRLTSWKVDAIVRAVTRPVSPPRRENCFPYPKGTGSNASKINPVSNRLRYSTPKLFHSIGDHANSFIRRLSLSLFLFPKLSKFEFPRSWKFHAAFEVTSNGSEDERARSRNFFACCVVVEVVEFLGWFSREWLWYRYGSKRYGNFDQNRWGYRCFIIRDGLLAFLQNCINMIIEAMFLGDEYRFLIRWARDLSTNG